MSINRKSQAHTQTSVESKLINSELAGLRRHEGLRLKPYKDTTGHLTIGYGRNLDDLGISKDEAEYLFRNSVVSTIRELRQKLNWFDKLDQVRQEVLVNMAYNLGVDGLLGFKNTLAFVEQGDYAQAAENMLQSLWAKQVKGRAIELALKMKHGGLA